MSSFFKNMDDKTKKLAMAFIKVLVVMLAILLLLVLLKSCTGGKVSYTNLENIMNKAAQDYYKSNQDRLPKSEGETVRISSTELTNAGYMKEMSKYSKDNCTGNVDVTKNGINYLYNVKLDCNGYKTKTISDVLQSIVVTEEDGLYFEDNEYYYRGKDVNNYIKIGDTLYRIIGIDTEENVKLIANNYEKTSIAWDKRFNPDKNQDLIGINDYYRSELEDTLKDKYNSTNDNIKKYVLEYDWCIAKRSQNDGSKEAVECKETLKGYFGTILPNEYARISLDENCKTVFDGTCKNYNYISDNYDATIWTMSSVKENSYESFEINSGKIEISRINKNHKLLVSFYISGNNIYVSGEGTLTSPYIIK